MFGLISGAILSAFLVGQSDENQPSLHDSRSSALEQLKNSLEYFYYAQNMHSRDAMKDTAVGIVSAFLDSSFMDKRYASNENRAFLRKMAVFLSDSLNWHRADLTQEAIQILMDEIQLELSQLKRSTWRDNFRMPAITGVVGWGSARLSYLIARKVTPKKWRFWQRKKLEVEESELPPPKQNRWKSACKTSARVAGFFAKHLVGMTAVGAASYYFIYRHSNPDAPSVEVLNEEVLPSLKRLKASLSKR